MLSELLDLLPSHVKVSVLLSVKGGRLNSVRGSIIENKGLREVPTKTEEQEVGIFGMTGSQGFETEDGNVCEFDSTCLGDVADGDIVHVPILSCKGQVQKTRYVLKH